MDIYRNRLKHTENYWNILEYIESIENKETLEIYRKTRTESIDSVKLDAVVRRPMLFIYINIYIYVHIYIYI